MNAARRWSLLLLAAFAAAIGSARAAPEPQPAYRTQGLDERTLTFILGNVQFLLAHELGHLVIGEFQVPVLGPEEYAADYIAATALIRTQRRDPERNARYRDYLLAAADAQRLAWEKGTSLGVPVPYWDSHALNIQRFYQFVCLLYGADPDTYAELPARIDLPAGRAAGCTAEFQQADRAINWLIATFGRKPGAGEGAPIEIRYEQPPSVVATEVAQAMRRVRLIETSTERVTELFALPRPMAVVVRRCGRAEAAWQPERGELVVCYELFDTFFRLSAARGTALP
jgi:hypothetical protein